MEKSYSIVLQSKIPSFIKDDPAYSKFISFFDSYYTWFNDTYKLNGFGDTIDIDRGYDQFLSYFQADFLPYFPENIATDKIKLLKVVKELYKTKGIPESFKFLFRALYDSYCEVTPTNDLVFKASDGKWIVPKSIKIKSTDTRFLNIKNLKIYGVQSQTIGLVESSKIDGNKTQIYLSNIERLFLSGEEIKILDANNKEVYFLNENRVEYGITPPNGAEKLTSKIIGSLSSINIDSKYRGELYKVGDPVVIVGGLNPRIKNPIKASAKISETTTGIITGLKIINGGYGFNVSPDTSIDVVYKSSIDTTANCVVSIVDNTQPANVFFLPVDVVANNYNITLSSNNYNFNTTSNIGLNSTLSDAFAFTHFFTYPIQSVVVVNGGGGYESTPGIKFNSLYQDNLSGSQNLKDLGILAPIQIVNAGIGYSTNDTLSIDGGDGDFAFAKIASVNSAGSITSVTYYQKPNELYTLGGMGYNLLTLPNVSISSANGSNASLIVPGILGDGVDYTVLTNKIGAISKIQLVEYGEDYINTPNVSLKIQDIAISNVSVTGIDNFVIFQGDQQTPIESTYFAHIDSFTKFDDRSLSTFSDDLYNLRVYDYRGSIDTAKPLKLFEVGSKSNLTEYFIENTFSLSGYTNGVKIYGDGSAQATAKFLNGLIIGEGKYLNTDGQPSAYSVLQSHIYNQSTYFLSSEKDYDSYKNVILNLVHPTGSQLIPRNLLRSNSSSNFSSNSKFNISSTHSNTNIQLITSVNTEILFSNTYSISGNIDAFSVNSSIFIETVNNMNVYSNIESIDYANNIITLSDYIQYKYINVYTGFANSNSFIIQQSKYSDSKYESNNFIFIGDSIVLLGNSYPIDNIFDSTLYFNTDIESIVGYTANQTISLVKSVSTNTISNYNLV